MSTRSDQLSKIPETITRADYTALIEAAGFDVGPDFRPRQAGLPHRQHRGHMYRVPDTDEVAKHVISVKVVD